MRNKTQSWCLWQADLDGPLVCCTDTWNMSNDKLQTACAWSLSNRAINIITCDRHFDLLSAASQAKPLVKTRMGV